MKGIIGSVAEVYQFGAGLAERGWLTVSPVVRFM